MAVAVRAHVDGLQLANVLLAVMAAGFNAAVNGLIHGLFPPQSFLSFRPAICCFANDSFMREKSKRKTKRTGVLEKRGCSGYNKENVACANKGGFWL